MEVGGYSNGKILMYDNDKAIGSLGIHKRKSEYDGEEMALEKWQCCLNIEGMDTEKCWLKKPLKNYMK
jgi:hypothetical protein